MRLRHLLLAALVALACGPLGAATFTATGTSSDVQVTPGNTLSVALSGVWVATVNIERKVGSAGYQPLYVAQSNATYTLSDPGTYHLNCIAYTSGTVTYTITAPAGYQVNYLAPNGKSVFSVDTNGVVAGALSTATVTGGTIDSTPIGATTPSTGAFTSLASTSLTVNGTSASLVNASAGSTIVSATNNDQTVATSVELDVIGHTSSDSRNAVRILYQPAVAAAQSPFFNISGQVSGIFFEGSAASVINQRTGSPLCFGVNDTEAMRISAAQRLIIGSTSDDGSNVLQINGNGAFKNIGNGLRFKEGTNGRMGATALTAGAVTVANTSVTASSRIFLTSNADGGTPGFVRVSARVAATSFTITSSSGTDTSTIAWVMYEPSP